MKLLYDLRAFFYRYAALISFSIALLIIFISILWKLIRKIKQMKKDRVIKTYNAKIVSKRIFEPDAKYSNMERRYYFDFELENGDRIEFPVSREVYENTREGVIGTLVFKGGKCVSFDFDK